MHSYTGQKSSGPKRNIEGYDDPTVFGAIKDIGCENGHEVFMRVMNAVYTIVDLAGFRIQGHISLRCKKTGKVYTR